VPQKVDLDQLCVHLRTLPQGSLVGIEGFMGSGKTHLSDALGTALGWHVVHTDEFVARKDTGEPYVQVLDLQRLKQHISTAVMAGSTLVDGICLGEVLARIAISVDTTVYVRRMAANGLWHDGLHLDDFKTDPSSVASEPGISDFQYHLRERPQERAWFEFHRVD